MMSRALGRKDYDTVCAALPSGFTVRSAAGILFSRCALPCSSSRFLILLGASPETAAATADYIKMDCGMRGNARHPECGDGLHGARRGAVLHASLGTASGCLLNIVLDPVFILPWGLGMGAEGRGYLLSNCVACLYFFVLLFVKSGRIHMCVRPGMFRFRGPWWWRGCLVGIPAAVQNLC